MKPTSGNRLGTESALYLRQHAHQPVHWQPWGDAAFAMARERDCPVFVSIGYSSCHWCHVMARECFDNADIARCLNDHFVCIKVDREMRPDIDQVFQEAHLLMRGRPGGWPLSAFVDPHTQLPFFVATYLPPEPRHGLPAFTDVLLELSRLYREDRSNIRDHGQALHKALFDSVQSEGGDVARSDKWLEAWLAMQDPQTGGTPGAPKFPLFASWLAVVDLAESLEPPKALDTALSAMALGGLRDHLTGGFFRYCVDDRWDIPHFEKMLYDNALALLLYARAASRWNRHEWAGIARGVASDLHQRFRQDSGGYVCAINAESEWQGKPEEGAYYLWSLEEIEQTLTAEERHVWSQCFDWIPVTRGDSRGHLRRKFSAGGEPLLMDKWQQVMLEQIRQKLESRRQLRPAPEADNKILLGWNGLLLWALSDAGRLLEDETIKKQALSLFWFLYRHFSGGAPARALVDGQPQGQAQLDDLAYVLNGLWAFLQLEMTPEALTWALQLRELLLTRFLGDDGWHQNPQASDSILAAAVARELSDNAMISVPVAATRACWLFDLWDEQPETHSSRVAGWIDSNRKRPIPPLAGTWAAFLRDQERLKYVRVQGPVVELEAWRQALRHEYTPGEALFFLPQEPERGETTALLCEKATCRSFSDVEALRQALVHDGRWRLLDGC